MKKKYLPLVKRLHLVFFVAAFVPYLLFLGFGIINNLLDAGKQSRQLHEQIVSSTTDKIDNYLKLLEVEMRLAVGKLPALEGASSTRQLNSLMSF